MMPLLQEAAEHGRDERNHPTLLLADPERLEDFDHARGVRLAVGRAMVDLGRGEQFEPNFLAIAPNDRIPAIVDLVGPDGAPISVFESGAIRQYLVRKAGRFGGETPREQVAVSELLFWQMGRLGPMAGQAHHFRL
jgi:glutathione S-transferase